MASLTTTPPRRSMSPVSFLRRPFAALLVALLLGIATAYTELSEEALRAIPGPGEDFNIKTGSLLAPLLIPRIAGTEGSLTAQNHFIDFFKTQLPEWKLEIHNTTAKTPATGDREVPFANLVFKRDPPWARDGDVGRLTLVAHYDSLYNPKDFIGATDSAAPCAMLMHVARSIEDALVKKWSAMQASGDAGIEPEMGVQILFLDGEEAFVSWTSTDSLYGARALAEQWESDFYPATASYRNPLRAISLFVLLDLLGSIDPWPRVPSYFLTTHWAYQGMGAVEKRMRDLGLLETVIPKGEKQFLPDVDKKAASFSRGYVEDDHIPFMARGVEILHIITSPFPNQWHNQKGIPDDGEHLSLPVCGDWAKIAVGFVAEYMDLADYMPKTLTKRDPKTEL